MSKVIVESMSTDGWAARKAMVGGGAARPEDHSLYNNKKKSKKCTRY
jgi:hypothetical protein